MAANIISGKGGAVNGENCVRLWQVARVTAPAEAVCSASDGAVVRGAGIWDWQGRYSGYGHTPSVLPGETFQFIGATRGSKGVQSVANGAIMEETRISWAIARGGFIEYVNSFKCATGALTFGSVSASDTSTPNPSVVRSCTLDVTGCEELQEMELVLKCISPSAVTATTAGGTERDVGNKDAEFTARILTKDASFPTESQVQVVNFDVGSGLSWTMTWGIVTLVAPLLPIEGPDLQPGFFQAQLAGKFTGYYSGTKGSITTPAGASWWP